MPRGKIGAGAPAKTPAAELNKQINKFGLSQAQVAKDVGLSVMTLKKLLDGEAKVDIERALIFAKYFGTTSDFWIELQKKAGLAAAKKNAKLQKQLKELKKVKAVKVPKGAKTAGAKRGPKPGAKRGPKPGSKRKVGRPPRSPSTPPTSSPDFM